MRNTSTITSLLFASILLSPLCSNAETNPSSITVSPTFTPIYNYDPKIEANPQFTNSPQFTNNPQITISPQNTNNNNVYSLTYTMYMEIKNKTIILIDEIKKK